MTTTVMVRSAITLLVMLLLSPLTSAQDFDSCPTTTPEVAQPSEDPNADPFPLGPWFINENRNIWAGWDASSLRVGDNKVLWIRPAGFDLEITAQRLDGDGDFEASIPCCYPAGFQATGLRFSDSGCWRISAVAGDETLIFVTRVAE